MDPMRRRSVLKLLSLSALAVTAAPVLAGCAQDPQDPGLQGGGAVDGVDAVELVAADVERAPGDPVAIPVVVAAAHRSGGALFGRLVGTSDNLVLSPYSVQVALAMTANGAAGRTRAELERAIGDLPVESANPGLNALTAHVESLAGPRQKVDGTPTEVVLDAANTLFGQRDVRWEQPFLEVLGREYGAGLRTVDYAGATEAAREAVNAWTAQQTRDKVPEILLEGSVDPSTRLVLVNTLYLKAPWETPFEKALTQDGDFTLLDGTTVRTPLMRTAGPVAVETGSAPGWRSVRLPYAGRELAMTVVLPDPGRYADIEADLVAGGLADLLALPDRDAPEQVEVTLPSWTFRTRASLKKALSELGVVAPFTAADLTPMTVDDLDLVVDDVLHEVFIAVDEEGTEAAAATAAIVEETSAPVGGAPFVADRPFLFVVHDVEHLAPLFVGRVLDPRS